MKSILLIGLGRFGKNVAMKLRELNHEVMAVDRNEKRVNEIMPYVTNARIGDSTDEEFLKSLGIRNYDLCFIAIGDCFQDSLETTSLVKELGGKVVVSRAASEVQAKFLKRNGADEVVFPEQQIARWAAIRYSSDHVFDYFAIDDDCAIFEVSVPDSWDGKTVGELDLRKKFQINVLAIKQNEKIDMNIMPETVFEAGETLLVLGLNKDVQKCFKI
ncbi:potassium channel family protein [Lachnospiraceae bacterium YH-ros2228]